MKAISIKNPYATQILRGTKTIEYRSWDTKHCGDLLVCSSANPKVPGMLSGYAICVVNLVDTTYNAADDIYEWHLEDVKKIKAFPVKGKLNFFDGKTSSSRSVVWSLNKVILLTSRLRPTT